VEGSDSFLSENDQYSVSLWAFTISPDHSGPGHGLCSLGSQICKGRTYTTWAKTRVVARAAWGPNPPMLLRGVPRSSHGLGACKGLQLITYILYIIFYS
jgi:hypothetical protein